MTTDANTTGTAIREARARAGLSQRAAAKRVGVSQPAWAQWESGACTPSVARLRDIARALGCTLRILLDPVDAASRVAISDRRRVIP